MIPNTQETADLVTFTEEIRNEKLHFFYAVTFKDNITKMPSFVGFITFDAIYDISLIAKLRRILISNLQKNKIKIKFKRRY